MLGPCPLLEGVYKRDGKSAVHHFGIFGGLGSVFLAD
jgi:hypothetical protein